MGPRAARRKPVVDVAVDVETGPLVELSSRATACPQAAARNSCPSSARARSTRTCSRIRSGASSAGCTARATARAAVDYEPDAEPATADDGLPRASGAGCSWSDRSRSRASTPVAGRASAALLRLRPGRPFVEEDARRATSGHRAVLPGAGIRGRARRRAAPRDARHAAARGRAGGGAAAPRRPARASGPLVGRITLNGASARRAANAARPHAAKAGAPFYPPQLGADRNAVDRVLPESRLPRRARGCDRRASGRPRSSTSSTNRRGTAVRRRPRDRGGQRRARACRRSSEEQVLTPGEPLGVDELADGAAAAHRPRAVPPRAGRGRSRPGDARATSSIVGRGERRSTNIGYGAGSKGAGACVPTPTAGDAVETDRVRAARASSRWAGATSGARTAASTCSRARACAGPGAERGPRPRRLRRSTSTASSAPIASRASSAGAPTPRCQRVRRAGHPFALQLRRRSVNADLRAAVGRQRHGRSAATATATPTSSRNGYRPEDKPLIDRLFPQVRLSRSSAAWPRDTRDDPIEPTRGHALGVERRRRGRALGSEVGFVKTFTQGFLYRRLPAHAGRVRRRRAPRAGDRASRGRSPSWTRTASPCSTPNGNPSVETVRGSAGQRTVLCRRRHHRPRLHARSARRRRHDRPATDSRPAATRSSSSTRELRFPVTRTLGGVVFVDAGNVFSRVPGIDLDAHPGDTPGFGIRYKSPIGPLRVDLGFKLDPQTSRPMASRSADTRCTSASGRRSDCAGCCSPRVVWPGGWGRRDCSPWRGQDAHRRPCAGGRRRPTRHAVGPENRARGLGFLQADEETATLERADGARPDLGEVSRYAVRSRTPAEIEARLAALTRALGEAAGCRCDEAGRTDVSRSCGSRSGTNSSWS